jgi:hypothetical protein
MAHPATAAVAVVIAEAPPVMVGAILRAEVVEGMPAAGTPEAEAIARPTH